jgi:hypothetical protein
VGKRRKPAKPVRLPNGRFASRETAQWVRVESRERSLDNAYKPKRTTSLKTGTRTKAWEYLASKARPEVEPLKSRHDSQAKRKRGYEVKQITAARKTEKIRKSRAKTKVGKPGLVKHYRTGKLDIKRSVWRFGWPHGIDLAIALTYVYEGRGNVRMNVSLYGTGSEGRQSIGSATESPFIVRDWLHNYEKLPSFANLMDNVDEDTLTVEVEVLEAN